MFEGAKPSLMKKYKIMLALLILPLVAIAKPVISEPTEIVNIQSFSPEKLVEHYTLVYGGDVELNKKIISCESQWKPNAVGDSGHAYGLFQFHRASFDRMAKALGEELDYYSPHDQIKLGVWAIKNGYGREWTSYRAIQNGGTYSFYSKLLKKHFTIICK